QHQLQCPQRAGRLLSRARLSLLHGDQHGRAGFGELRALQGRAAQGQAARNRRVFGAVRPGLTTMSLVQVNWKPDQKQLRGFGWIALVAFGLIGAWVSYKHVFFVHMQPETAAIVAKVLWAVAGVCGVLAIAAPAALKPLYISLTVISLPI